jgi:signal transduction histidine kinase
MNFVFPKTPDVGGEASDGFHQELLRGLTHKFNNMLAVVKGFSGLILTSGKLDPSLTENMQHIREASDQVQHLSERIRAAGGCSRVSPQSLSLNTYMSMVEGSLREPFTKLNVPFTLEVQPDLPPVLVDSSRLKEILTELLRNAAEACAGTGGVAVMKVCGPGTFTPPEERRVDILISNTASQIPADKLDEIFKPFRPGKDSAHLGLGLTIATMLSAQMKIQLGVASENMTTTFWLSCPVA